MNIMKYIQTIFLISCTFIMSACSEKETDAKADFSGWEKSLLIYSYPVNGQENVSINSNISLSFTHEIADEGMTKKIKVLDSAGLTVNGTSTLVEGYDSTVVFTPSIPFKQGESYTVGYSGLNFDTGEIDQIWDLNFSVEPITGAFSNAHPRGLTPSGEPVFSVINEFPDSGLPFMDFSVIHLTLNEYLDVSTVKLGDSFRFINSKDKVSVPGNLIVKGQNIIFDPDKDLIPGEKYTLSLTNDITSISGLPLTPFQYSNKIYTPNDSQPRSILVQQVLGEPGNNLSPLSGAVRNTIPLTSTLMGDVLSYANGDYHTELAYIPNYSEAVPFVIRKGSVLKGSSMDVNIGGEISTGLSTGEIYLTLITDLSGYLISNTENAGEKAPSKVRIVLNAAMTTEHIITNGALSQDVLHVDLYGTAEAIDGSLVVDALGSISPTLLGVEDASVLVAFSLEAYPDQLNAPEKNIDEKAPFIHSWVPGDSVSKVDPADSILVVFSEPLQASTLQDQISLELDGVKADTHIRIDGSTVIIDPVLPLKYSSEYKLIIKKGVTDISNNPINEPFTKIFRTLEYEMSEISAPLVGSVYPGYACKMINQDLGNNIAGRCEGGENTDDFFNVFKLPADRNVSLNFNQEMNKSTFILGKNCEEGSVRIEELDENFECVQAVKGAIQSDESRITFMPSMPLEQGKMYQLTLNSSVSSQCDGSDDVICSAQNLPLRTVPLTLTLDNKHEGSGPFVISESVPSKVFNIMSQLPTVDVNRNFNYDDIETFFTQNSSKLSVVDTSGMVSSASIGCKDNSCSEKERIYLSGYFPVEIGVYDSVINKIPVDIKSQVLMATSMTMYTDTLIGTLENITGPLIMRMRNVINSQGEMEASTGYIIWDEAKQQAMFESRMNVYFDAPGLKPNILGVKLDANLHSYPLTIDLYGPVDFLPDGRMEIKLKNLNTVNIEVDIGIIASISMRIFEDDLSFDLVSKMMKQ